MRRILAVLAVVALAAFPLSASAEEPAASSSSASTSSSSSDMGGGMHDSGGLFDTADHHRNHAISAFVYTPYDYGFGIGAALRYTLPIVPDGFISKLNDSFELEMGLDYAYSWYGYFGSTYGVHTLTIPAVDARWSFHFTRRWEAYGKAGVGFRYRAYESDFGHQGALDWVYVNVAVGGLLHFNDSLALRAEVGYGGLRFGIAFAF